MSVRGRTLFLSVALAVSLAGCGSAPMHFFELTAVPATAAPRHVAGPPIEVRPVSIPPVLDRHALVTATGGTGVAISGNDRWAAPLDGMVQRTLAADLNTLLPGHVVQPSDPAPPRDARPLQVNIERFMPDQAGRVTLVADWALFAHRRRVAGRREQVQVAAASARPDDATAAMSRGLGELAARIARAIPER